MPIIKIIGLSAEEIRQFGLVCMKHGKKMTAVLRDYIREVIRNDHIKD